MAKPRARTKTNDPPVAKASTETRVEQWLNVIADGDSIKQACEASGLPWTTVRRLMAQDEAFGAQYVAAKQAAAALHAEMAGEILNSAARQVDPADDAGPYVTVQRARADHYRWLAGVKDRRTYGDKQQIEQDTTMRVVVEYAAPTTTKGE